jgi:hypothetical protein
MSSELTHVGSLDDAPRHDTQPDEDDPAPPSGRHLGRRAAKVIGLPFLVSSGVIAALLVFGHATFEINDDTTLNAIANGDYTGHRSSSLVVAPAMLAHVMRAGYALLPNLPWYGITLYALQAIAWTAIGVVAFTLRRRPALPERLLIIATMLVLVPWMILRVSFTPTSLLLGAAGILVFAASAQVRGRVGLAYAAAGGALLGTLYFIRVFSFEGVVIAFAPALAFIVWKAGVRRTAVFAIVVGMFVVVGFGTNRLQYGRSAEWRAFMTENAARSSLHATPRLEQQNVPLKDLTRIGWSQNDLRLFADFFYPDKHVYSAKAIKTLAKLSPRVADTTRVSNIFNKLRGPFVAIPLAVAVLLALRRSRAAALFTLATALWLGAVLIALLLYVRLPNRVLIPFEGGAVFIVAIAPSYLTAPSKAKRPAWFSIAVVALLVVLLAPTVWNGVLSPVRISRDNAHELARRTRAYEGFEEIDPKGIFIARGDFFGLNANPLAVHTPFENPRFIALGWATNSPLFTARLARVGITDVYRSLARNPHVYLYGKATEIRNVALFFKQHRGAVTYEKVGTHTIYGYNVWKFHLVHPTPVPAKAGH